jgi:Domain of Unknown Function (DUF326)
MHAQQMADTHPGARGRANDALTRCIESCFDCAQACTSCADACLSERSVAELRQCIRLDLDCADVCIAAGAVATRRTANQDALLVQMLETCAGFCRLCAEECEKHARHHEHCRGLPGLRARLPSGGDGDRHYRPLARAVDVAPTS